MIRTIYLIVLAYFAVGLVFYFFIGHKLGPEKARHNWIKLLFYFLIINITFFSIAINTSYFRILAALIIIVGFYELFNLWRISGFAVKEFYIISTIIYLIFCTGFCFFSGMEKGIILFTFMILSIFDSFCQIAGQLWGRTKLFPMISPQKTVEGFIGGTIVALLSGYLLRNLIPGSPMKGILLAIGIALFAFIGDLTKSIYKRKFGVKNFSNLIPEHGGLLDRFDSLIAGGAFIALIGILTEL
ncbi:MAG: phosphatidate cytidylyltransferase [Bacteroidota bacterium]|nr:phosphatidate cytidylyltransferase [Bacteroidota bacterium]